MDYAISTWIAAAAPGDEALALLAASGFSRIELSADACALVRAWEEDPVGTRRRLDAAGLQPISIHSPEPGRFLDHPDEARRDASLAANLAYLRGMEASDIPEIVIHPSHGGAFENEERRVASRRHARCSLEKLAEEARRRGLRLAVENLGGPNHPAARMEQLLSLIEGLGDHVGICFDVGHAEQARFSLLRELETALGSGKLFSLHLHDVLADNRDHFVPGEGRILFEPVIARLDHAGFSGGRVLEIAVAKNDLSGRLHQTYQAARRFMQAAQ
ncbi:MAG: sugar phosphate isomerase/epimerase family protein [Armatimonadota bacterium]|nr:sugar phosphate isomerase/epimerase family protein [Armatimonadota bacterium]